MAPELLHHLGTFFQRDFFDPECRARLLAEVQAVPSQKGRILVGDAQAVLIESARKVLCADVKKTTIELVKERLVEIKPRLEAHLQVPLIDFVTLNSLLYKEGAFLWPARRQECRLKRATAQPPGVSRSLSERLVGRTEPRSLRRRRADLLRPTRRSPVERMRFAARR